MSAAFGRAFALVIGHEGGYVDHPSDPGGETKFGISKRAYPAEDLRNLTLARAATLYRRDYWDALGCGSLPGPLALLVFDAGVNCGVSRSAKWLQAAVGVAADGKVGPGTLAAARKAAAKPGGAVALCREVLVSRLFHHIALSTWKTFGLGWARRLFTLPFDAATMPQDGAS